MFFIFSLDFLLFVVAVLVLFMLFAIFPWVGVILIIAIIWGLMAMNKGAKETMESNG